MGVAQRGLCELWLDGLRFAGGLAWRGVWVGFPLELTSSGLVSAVSVCCVSSQYVVSDRVLRQRLLYSVVSICCAAFRRGRGVHEATSTGNGYCRRQEVMQVGLTSSVIDAVAAKKLAIITSHPIQYYAPWFRALAKDPELLVRVFYLWDFGVTQQVDAGFQRAIQWDV